MGKNTKVAAPDYTPVAQASKESAELMAQLGREQMAEAKRQYDQDYALAQQVVGAQMGLMDQARRQGDFYFDYFRSRAVPLEDQMLREASAASADQYAPLRQAVVDRMEEAKRALQDKTSAYEDELRGDIDLYTGGSKGVYDRYGRDIDYDVALSLADTRAGQTNALNQAIRQARRYGAAVDPTAAYLGLMQASQNASAATNARINSLNNYRNLVGQGIGLKQGLFSTVMPYYDQALNYGVNAAKANRDMTLQDDSIAWAKKLDMSGVYRGMPGNSQGAYGLAVGAGNAAVANQQAPGAKYLSGMGQGIGTIGMGQQMQLQGLSSILGSQTNMYNAALANQGAGLGGLLGFAGRIGAAAMPYIFSDRRLKDDIDLVGVDEDTGLNIYEFSYRNDPLRNRFRGVMADEVEKLYPDAVVYDADGYAMVDYAKLGIPFERV